MTRLEDLGADVVLFVDITETLSWVDGDEPRAVGRGEFAADQVTLQKKTSVEVFELVEVAYVEFFDKVALGQLATQVLG